jgi:hypothetical protein
VRSFLVETPLPFLLLIPSSFTGLSTGQPTTLRRNLHRKFPFPTQTWLIISVRRRSLPVSALGYLPTSSTVTTTTSSGFELGGGQAESDISTFVTLAKSNGSKPVFTVGGWDGSIYFSDLVGSEANRTAFATEIQAFLKKWDFEGVDIGAFSPFFSSFPPALTQISPLQTGNIPTAKASVRPRFSLSFSQAEPLSPGCNSITTSDSANLLLFLQTLRSTIGSSKLITAAVSTSGFLSEDGTTPLDDFSEYATYLDYLNLMTYDVSCVCISLSPLKALRTDLVFPPPHLVAALGHPPPDPMPLSAPAVVTPASKQPSSSGLPAVFPLKRSCCTSFFRSLSRHTPTFHFSIAASPPTPSPSPSPPRPSQRRQSTTSGLPTSTKSGIRSSLKERLETRTLRRRMCAGPRRRRTRGSGSTRTVPIFPVLSSEHALTVPASLLLQLLSSNGSTGLNGFKRRFDSCSQTPFLFNPDKKQLIAYDDGKSASVKAVRRFRSFFL